VQPTAGSVEAIRQVLAYLVTEREQLSAHGAGPIELEANQKAIAAMEWRLGRRLALTLPASREPDSRRLVS
jgi:hypothetical protein